MSSLPRTADEYRAWWVEQTDVPYGYCWCGCGERTNIAKKSDFRDRKILLGGEPTKYRKGHSNFLPRERYVTKDCGHLTPCWIWQGAHTGNNSRPGYGYIRVGKRTVYMHRYFYEEKYGEIPSNLEIDHLCRQTLCVNPEHVEPVTPAENNRRKPNIKLTPEDVRAVRTLAAQRNLKQREIAAQFGISLGYVSNIAARRTWADLD